MPDRLWPKLGQLASRTPHIRPILSTVRSDFAAKTWSNQRTFVVEPRSDFAEDEPNSG